MRLDMKLLSENFNPRPLCRGRRCDFFAVKIDMILFQSTPPVQGATFHCKVNVRLRHVFQSTPPVQGATDALSDAVMDVKFQSTPPVQGATRGDAELSST